MHGTLFWRVYLYGVTLLLLAAITVGVTAGASCPNNLIEDTIRRVCELRGVDPKVELGLQ